MPIFRKIFEIEGFALRAAILHECQNYLEGGDGLGGSDKHEKKNFPRPPPPTAIIFDARPLGTFENQAGRAPLTVRRAISWRSHEKTGNHEQSSQIPEFIQYISSRFFENQPKEICSHLCEKASKGTFIKPEKLQNQSNQGKGKEPRKSEERERRRRILWKQLIQRNEQHWCQMAWNAVCHKQMAHFDSLAEFFGNI